MPRLLVAVAVAALAACGDEPSSAEKISAAEAARELRHNTKGLRVRCIPSSHVRMGLRWGDYFCMYYEEDGRLIPQSGIGVKVDDEKIVERTG